MSAINVAFGLAFKLVPTVKKLAAATKKGSPGGKKVTAEELADILGNGAILHDILQAILDLLGIEVEDDEAQASFFREG